MSDSFQPEQAFELIKSLAEGGCIHLRGINNTTDVRGNLSNAQFDAEYMKNLYYYLTGKDLEEARDELLRLQKHNPRG